MWLHIAVFALGGLVTAYLTLALIASAKASSTSVSRAWSRNRARKRFMPERP